MPVDYKINLLKIEDKHRELLAKFINGTQEPFIDKDVKYQLDGGDTISFSHNLVTTQPNQDSKKKFYVISQKEEAGSTLGLPGKSGRARVIWSSIETDKNGNIVEKPVTGKCVRIKNILKAQRNTTRAIEAINEKIAAGEMSKEEGEERIQPLTYTHKEAEKEYEIAKNFPHLGMEAPIERKTQKKELGEFSKSYSVMNMMPGDTDEAIHEFRQFDMNKAVQLSQTNQLPDTKKLIDVLILPILTAYQEQVANTGHVHCDIKADNVRIALGPAKLSTPATVNFIDFDSALKIGAVDKPYGTPGYIPPELFFKDDDGDWVDKKDVEVRQERDTFSLGVFLLGVINPVLDAVYFFGTILDAQSRRDALEKSLELYTESKCCDPQRLISIAMEHTNAVFDNLWDDISTPQKEKNVAELQNKIIDILKQMTNVDPGQRPSLDEVIRQFKEISLALENKPALAETKQISSTLSTIRSMQSQPEVQEKILNEITSNTQSKSEEKSILLNSPKKESPRGSEPPKTPRKADEAIGTPKTPRTPRPS